MKKFVLYLLIVLFVIPVKTEAKVWRVNNNVSVTADFTDINDAVAACAPGDTIHLEPSETAYHAEQFLFDSNNKHITIIGNGYFHFVDDFEQQNILTSIIDGNNSPIFITSKVKFIGIVFNAPVIMWKYLNQANNITDVSFESCQFNNNIEAENIYASNGLHFSKNYIGHHLIVVSSSNPSSTFTDFSFENNICLDEFSITSLPVGHDLVLVRNNVFAGNFNCVESYCANNIFKNGISTDPSGLTGCVLKNNLFTNQSFTTGAALEANNQFSVDMSTVFVNNPAFFDRAYELAGGPGVGAGIPNGSTPVDCGAYGGPNPYKPFGMPAIPSITHLSVPSTVISGTDIHISLSSKSNN